MTTDRYEQRWPELYAGLTAEQRSHVSGVLANGRLEGWSPTRDEVADLTAHARGEISRPEYLRRAHERAITGAATLAG